MKRRCVSFLLTLLIAAPALLLNADEPKPATSKPAADAKGEKKSVALFDGKSLGHWKSTNFGGEGEVEVKDGRLILNVGSDLTGITWQKPDQLPRTNYELQYEAMRVDGNDFFCGLTFPVQKNYCSLILGGWGGGVCGVSSIDGNDASENETTTYKEFETGKWYSIRLRVRDEHIEAWIDGKQIVDIDVKGRRLNVRGEVELSQPLGFATWRTTGALRKVELQHLPAAEPGTKNDDATTKTKPE